MTLGLRCRLAGTGRRTRHRSPAPAISSWPSALAPPPAPARWCGPPGRPLGWRSGRPGWRCPRPTSPKSCGNCPSTGATRPWPGRPRCAGRCPARPACTPPSPAWSAACPVGPPQSCGICRAGQPGTVPATNGRPSMPPPGREAGSCGYSPSASPSRAGSSWAAPRVASDGCWPPRTATRCWCSAPPAARRPPAWSSRRSWSGPGRSLPPRSSRTCCGPPWPTAPGAAR